MLWVGGGLNDVQGLDDVETSLDGVTWMARPSFPTVRGLTDFATFHDRVYVAGGDDNDVYSSADASAWRLEGSLPLTVTGGGFVAFTPR